MKYFLIGTDEKNRNPYNINKNRALDIRKLTREGIVVKVHATGVLPDET